ncbi:MAG: glycine cleavage system aminomethyltransferase GcvT [Phycisphaerae bacterium]
MTKGLLHTPLYETHLQFGGKMVDFAGWSLPISFVGITQEHLHTRKVCSVFDVSHMGRLIVAGKDAEPFLNRLCTRNLADAEIGRSYYTHMCKEDGGILDDLIVSRFEEHWGVVCNGANRQKIVYWLEKHASGSDVELQDRTLDTAMVAVQGPEAVTLAGELAHTDFSSLKRYRFTTKEAMGNRIAVYRSGYTGEDGLEIIAPSGMIKMFSAFLFGTPDQPHPKIKPAGLGARDTLRIEAGMPLYGHELSEDVDSVSAGQGWCVDLGKDFIGAEAMRKRKEAGPSKTLVGLELEGKRIARQHFKVFAGPRAVGEVTSGTLSPTLGKSIAMAMIEADAQSEGTPLEVDLGKTRAACRVVKLPFYKRAR